MERPRAARATASGQAASTCSASRSPRLQGGEGEPKRPALIGSIHSVLASIELHKAKVQQAQKQGQLSIPVLLAFSI